MFLTKKVRIVFAGVIALEHYQFYIVKRLLLAKYSKKMSDNIRVYMK